MAKSFRPLAVVLLCVIAGATAAGQTIVRAVRKGSVAGNVTIKGKPAAGVPVGILSAESNAPFEPTYKAVSDLQGLYRVSDIPQGNYRVNEMESLAKLNRPDKTELRTQLKREADLAKQSIEFKPCENKINFEWPMPVSQSARTKP